MSASTEVMSVWTHRLRCCSLQQRMRNKRRWRSSPWEIDETFCLCYQGLPAHWTRGKRQWRAFSVHSACEQLLQYEADCDAGRVCVRRQSAPGNAAVTSNRLLHASEWKCVISRFMLPFRSPSPPASQPTVKVSSVVIFMVSGHGPAVKEAKWWRFAISQWTPHLLEQDWRLIKQAHIGLGTLHKKKGKAFKDPLPTTWEPGGWKLEERDGGEDDVSD